MNALAQINNNQFLDVLKKSIFPDVNDDEIIMLAVNYCKARNLDIMLKPIHIVPRSVKKKDASGNFVKSRDGKFVYEDRYVIMPGIGTYRIDASRTGEYAGMSEPEFGEDVTQLFDKEKVTYPKWCKITVKRKINGMIAEFTAKEYWIENYATKNNFTSEPTMIWKKRAYGQLAKCCEAQALRKAFPEAVGTEPTHEEMEGKLRYESFPEPKNQSIIEIKPEVNIDEIKIETKNEVDETLRMDAIALVNEATNNEELKEKFFQANALLENDLEGRKILNKETKKLKDKFTVQEFNEDINEETGEVQNESI